MTRAHDVPPVAAPDLGAAVAVLRARGLRVSASRRLVLEVLFEATEPLTAEQVAAGLGGRSDVASVYRNLEALEAVGLVRGGRRCRGMAGGDAPRDRDVAGAGDLGDSAALHGAARDARRPRAHRREGGGHHGRRGQRGALGPLVEEPAA